MLCNKHKEPFDAAGSALSGVCAQARSEIETLTEQRAVDESKLFEALETETELAALKDRLAATSSKSKAACEALNKSKAAAEAATLEAKELRVRVRELEKREASASQSTNKATHRADESLHDSLCMQGTELTNARHDLKKARTELKAARESAEELSAQCRAAEEDRDAALDSVKDVKRQKGAVETKLGSSTRELKQQREELKEMESQLQLWQQKCEVSDRSSRRTSGPAPVRLTALG